MNPFLDLVECFRRSQVHAALPGDDALLIAEALLDDHIGSRPALLQSLNVLTRAEGRERSFPEYQALLTAAGFTQVNAHRTGAPLDAILARK